MAYSNNATINVDIGLKSNGGHKNINILRSCTELEVGVANGVWSF